MAQGEHLRVPGPRTCQVVPWLGRAYRHHLGERKLDHDRQGDGERGPPWRNLENRGPWTFLADHAVHPLRPTLERDLVEFTARAVERWWDGDGFNLTAETRSRAGPGDRT